MVGIKDTVMIFEQYRKVLAEQQQNNNIQSIINQINTSALAPEVKQGLVSLLKDPQVASKWNVGDADTVNAGDPNFAKELSTAKYGAPEQDLANAPDPNFAKEMAAARKAQEDAYPESEVKKFLGEEEEEPMPTEAPWWVPGEDAKERWLSTQQGHWRQTQKEKQEQGRKTT